MRSQDLSSQLQRIRSLIKGTHTASANDLELQSHWAKYLCVLCAGLLEDSMTQIYGDYAKRSANPIVASYVFSQLDRVQNPKTQKFVEISSQFSKSWGAELELFVATDGRKEAIDAIMANRNNIVHGGSSGITISRLTDYLDKSIEVLEYIESKTLGA